MNMKMKFLLASAMALISSAALWGQATKVALINMQQALAQTKEGQAQIAALEKKYGPKTQELQKRATEIQAKQELLKKNQATLSDEAKSNQQQEITRLQTSLQRDQTDIETDSNEDEQKMVQGIYGKLVQAVTKVAQDGQIMLVFDVSSQPNNLVCCGSAPDITKDVIALYDKTNPAGGAAGGAAAGTAAAPPASKPAGTVPRPPAATPPARPPATNTK